MSHTIRLKGVITTDFINGGPSHISMTLEFPFCDFKCGVDRCQNAGLVNMDTMTYDIDTILGLYQRTTLTDVIVLQGLEPLHPDSIDEAMDFCERARMVTNDPIIIYTGYTEAEVRSMYPGQMSRLHDLTGVVMKVGRYNPDLLPKYDPILGLTLASSNQHSIII